MSTAVQPIVIKKIVKKGGHHGGAWKVAFADFATAMMAFFMLMWLLGSTSETERGAISEYFQNPSRFAGESDVSGSLNVEIVDEKSDAAALSLSESMVEEVAERIEERRLQELMEELQDAIDSNSALNAFKDQLLLDITSEGLRVQIVDRANRPMFEVGSDTLQSYTAVVMRELTPTLNLVPNRISISGHTDARPYTQREDYGNWELSTDRANAARRALITSGMAAAKIGRIVGLGDSVLFDKQDPFAPVNRRISLIVMNRATDESVIESGEATSDVASRDETDEGTAPADPGAGGDGGERVARAAGRLTTPYPAPPPE